ncbi:MAG: VWA domain-containing protein [Acidobacteriota bacterium]
MKFGAPAFLLLLAIPAALLPLWAWQAWRRAREVQRFHLRRQVPVRERMPYVGDLAFWLCLLLASALLALALARPQAVTSISRIAGVDLVVLLDGSASMRVRDVQGNRWQRSVEFLRMLGESMRWENDRVALALFAHIATPQVRLTTDPNTYFFFLDHLGQQSPFPIEDDTTWDTNIERGIYWGLRLAQRDEEMHGPPKNGQAFVLVSDGQAWSGEVAKAIAQTRERGMPVHVVGVGTTAGGVIPDPNRDPARAVLTSQLDRASLTTIATAAGGRYFELGREDDRTIAASIIDVTRRQAASSTMSEAREDLYWWFLAAAAALLALGVLFLRDRAALAFQVAAAGGALALLASLA